MAAAPRSSTSLPSQYSGAVNHPMAVTPWTVAFTPTRVSSQPAGKPAAHYSHLFAARRAIALGHADHGGRDGGERNHRQQLNNRGMAGVAVDRSPGDAAHTRPGQNQPPRPPRAGEAGAQ